MQIRVPAVIRQAVGHKSRDHDERWDHDRGAGGFELPDFPIEFSRPKKNEEALRCSVGHFTRRFPG
jgi:hypothetical protein